MGINVYVEKFYKIGYITIRTDENFIIGVSFGKDYPKNQYSTNTSESIVEKFFKTLEKYVRGKRVEFDFPFKLKNVSEFSKNVYYCLKNIPFGEVKSYKDIAREIGNERAYRAVGNACAKNPLPLIIPCHRVVRHNGMLGGFTGGAETKKLLLSLERCKKFFL